MNYRAMSLGPRRSPEARRQGHFSGKFVPRRQYGSQSRTAAEIDYEQVQRSPSSIARRMIIAGFYAYSRNHRLGAPSSALTRSVGGIIRGDMAHGRCWWLQSSGIYSQPPLHTRRCRDDPELTNAERSARRTDPGARPTRNSPEESDAGAGVTGTQGRPRGRSHRRQAEGRAEAHAGPEVRDYQGQVLHQRHAPMAARLLIPAATIVSGGYRQSPVLMSLADRTSMEGKEAAPRHSADAI